MPELPEVQTIVDALIAQEVLGKRIEGASVFWPGTIATSSARRFCQSIENKTVLDIQRRGKFIVFRLSEGLFMAVHLRMSGRFELRSDSATESPHEHVVLSLDDQRHLAFHDTRKFGRFYLTDDIMNIVGGLGPEPLTPEFTSKKMAGMLASRRRLIKPLLLDQRFLAGLGNIYVDEALWRSRIHPLRTADSLQWPEVKSLYRAIRHVLRQAVRNGGTSLGKGLGNYTAPLNRGGRNSLHLKVFRRSGQACFTCGQPIQRIVVEQRGTHVCQNCQR